MTVTVSPEYQVVIPEQIREQLGLQPGQKLQALVFNGRIELIKLRPMKKMRGFLPGLRTEVDRDVDRR